MKKLHSSKIEKEKSRVVIIGSGFVGSTSAFAILAQGIASEIVLIDKNTKKNKGEAMDLEHGISFAPPAKIWAGDYKDCKDADIIVIAAGIAQKPGQNRLQLLSINASIMKDVVKNIKKHTTDAILIVVSNPLDVLTSIALKTSGFSRKKVLGTGTMLDSSRFRELLGECLGVAAESVNAYLIGEHGDSSVPVLSHANVMGESIQNLPQYRSEKSGEACENAKSAAYEIIRKKGATYYAIGLCVARLVRAILRDEHVAFPVSTLLTGQYGIKNICFSLPAIIGRGGVEKIIPIRINAEEKKKLQESANIIRASLKQI